MAAAEPNLDFAPFEKEHLTEEAISFHIFLTRRSPRCMLGFLDCSFFQSHTSTPTTPKRIRPQVHEQQLAGFVIERTGTPFIQS